MERELVKIKVIGVGGGGGNAINEMISSGADGVEYIAINTDKQDLDKSLADIKLQIGTKLTKGQGAGADPSVGASAAEEDIEKIKALLDDTDMVFIAAGMGGGTGTGASPIVAKLAREMGVLTVAVVTKPFTFERKKRMKNAESGIEKLKQVVDSILVIPNDRLFQLPDKSITLEEAFKEANKILKIGIKGIAHLIVKGGLINLDFSDIKTVISNSGTAVLGFGEGEGENRMSKAIEQTLQSPLLERNIVGAKKILLNITANNLGLAEAQQIANEIGLATSSANNSNNEEDEDEDLLFGLVNDPEIGDKIQITLIATFIRDEVEKIETATNSNNDEVVQKTNLDIPPWSRK